MSGNTRPAGAGMPSRSDIFGHPRGLTFLFLTETWERFSYYGMRTLLVLYMVTYLLQPDRAERVIGLMGLKALLERLFGPLAIQPFSSYIYGLYTSLVYLAPIFGGLLADRVWGQRNTVIVGAALMAIGHLMMAFESMFLPALLALVLGNGAFKPNISTQVGSLYAAGDIRRDRAYSIFYVGINLGAFLAPIVCGTLGETVGWRYGFTAAGVGMMIGLAIYLFSLPSLPPDQLHRALPEQAQDPLTAQQKRALFSLLALFLPVSLFWATYEQQGNTIALWAQDFTDKSVNLGFWRGEIPTTWFQSVNPILIFAFTPGIVTLWRWQAARGSEPSTVIKMAYGCFGAGLSYLVLVVAAWLSPDRASWLWLLLYFAVITVAELYISPISISLISKVAPAHMLSLLMGVWLSTGFLGNLLSGWLGGLWGEMGKAAFFLLLAAISAAAGVMIALFERVLGPALEAGEP